MNKIKIFFKSLFGTSDKEKIKEEILSETIDFENIVSSSLLAKGLYDELKKVCHPDKFQKEEDISKATVLFQQLVQNKGNYNKLQLLKEQIYSELPISK